MARDITGKDASCIDILVDTRNRTESAWKVKLRDDRDEIR